MFRFRCLAPKALVFSTVVTTVCASTALAAVAAPGLVKQITANTTVQSDVLATNPEAEGPNFSPGYNIFGSPDGVPYGLDSNGVLDGNNVLVVTQSGNSNNTGAGFTLHVSNGENGTDYFYNANPGGPI